MLEIKANTNTHFDPFETQVFEYYLTEEKKLFQYTLGLERPSTCRCL